MTWALVTGVLNLFLFLTSRTCYERTLICISHNQTDTYMDFYEVIDNKIITKLYFFILSNLSKIGNKKFIEV